MRKSMLWAFLPFVFLGANGFAQEPAREPSPSMQKSLPEVPQPPAAVVSGELNKSFPSDKRKPPRDERSVSGGVAEKAQAMMAGAARVLEKMKADPDAASLLGQAKGVLILPSYARGGLVVGGEGGKGVLVLRRDGQWTGPAIYRMGSINIGAQAGGSAGSAALLLMSDRAIERFQRDHGISLNADAGLTVLDYSARKHATRGGDIVLWSDARGAYAGASLGVADVSFDADETAAIIGHKVEARQALSGDVRTAPAAQLLAMLPPA